MRLWGRVCKDRDWPQADRAFRLQTFSQIIGRPIASADQIERIDECTKLMKELTTLLGVSVRAALEADNLYINQARVLRHQILTELIPCLELYIEDVRSYLTAIIEDKNRWWKIDRPARDITLMDLDARPIEKLDAAGRPRSWPSQLKQLQYTLSARLNDKRNAAGHSIHDMRQKAGVPCHCAKCFKAAAKPALQPF